MTVVLKPSVNCACARPGDVGVPALHVVRGSVDMAGQCTLMASWGGGRRPRSTLKCWYGEGVSLLEEAGSFEFLCDRGAQMTA